MILSFLPRTSVPTLTLLSLATFSCFVWWPQRAGYSESGHAVDIPCHTTRSHFSHAHPPHPCMGMGTNSGVSMPRILAHMDSLRFLTLPSFYLHILCHHTTILNLGIHIRLSGQAKRELLKWLDSQTNMVSFRFPFLLDNDGDTSPLMPFPPTLTCTRLPPVPTMPSPPFMPPLSSLPPTPTLTEDIQAPFCSSILQP